MDNLQSYAPGSVELGGNVIEGYQPYSRVNELVHNCFVDENEWNLLSNTGLTRLEADMTTTYDLTRLRALMSMPTNPIKSTTLMTDMKPDYHDWSSMLPGYILVMRKMRDLNWRNKLTAETAAPVIGCAQGKCKAEDDQFLFAGVCRSKSIKKADDGRGPRSDDHFTMFIGGVCTILNNGRCSLHPGDSIAWTFELLPNDMTDMHAIKRPRAGPRRIQVVRVPPGCTHPRMFGRCLKFAKPGDTIDVLIGPVSS